MPGMTCKEVTKMFKMAKKIIEYPRLTQEYPAKTVNSSLFIGSPEIDQSKCTRCGECVKRCPSRAIVTQSSGEIGINLDECVFCALCEEVCPAGATKMSTRFELAEKDREHLRKSTFVIDDNNLPDDAAYELICGELKEKIKKHFGRSLKIREVDAGSCNACDYEINALNNPVNDIERLGISFVASPRHADMLLVTGAATRNMQLALIKTYNATPDPKLVVAVGACACSGGIFRETYASTSGIDSIVPVDVYIPGCPPRPQSIIYGILKALDRMK
jgi:Ni,Fe-hydrogenase III small subunit/formate hydrogenlyase subunit 6/NADH:ubiquinone oxidoreductase subunit I